MKKRLLACILLTNIGLMMQYQTASAGTVANSPENMIYAMDRLGFGASDETLREIREVGVNKWIDEQLHAQGPQMPANVQQQIDQMEISRMNQQQLIDWVNVPKEMNNNENFKAMVRSRQELLVYETFRRQAIRDMYSPNQLLENMTWFWGNHFSVFSQKGPIKEFLADYEDNAIRAHALGNFEDLVRATLEHPAMSIFLDNYDNTAPDSLVNANLKPNQTPKGINENYAREILELHTLGQGNGYTQKDVQELARILTGFSFRKNTDPVRIRAEYQPYVVTQGLFFFDPRRHDFGDKVFMGHVIKGSGYHEIDQVLDIICNSPYTAIHISQKLAWYFLDDNPSVSLVNTMSEKFLQTHGNIPAVLSVLFHSKEFWAKASQQSKFRMPHQYVIASLRLEYGDYLMVNYRPVWNTLNNLGEQPYGHQTPEGYALKQKDWASADQMEKRLEFAQFISGKKTRLFSEDETLKNAHDKIEASMNMNTMMASGVPATNNTPVPQVDNPASFDNSQALMSPVLSDKTIGVLEQANSNEKMGFLLSSPEMMNY
jgi:uncharacterized protein (DUF1800 family)